MHQKPVEQSTNGLTLLHTLSENKGRIGQMRWSPDGQYIAAPSMDNHVYIWNAATGEHIQTLTGHTTPVSSVAWSPDSRMMASGSFGQTVRVWDLASGEMVLHLMQHTALVRDVAWSPDGQILASASDDHSVCLWDTYSGKLIKQFPLFHRMTCVVWSRDGQSLAAGSDDGQVFIWNTASDQLPRALMGHKIYVLGIAWSPDKTWLASASYDTTIRVWNTETWQSRIILESHVEGVVSASISADGRLLASKSMDDTVRLWDTATWNCIAQLSEPSSTQIRYWHSNLQFHPTDPNILATLGHADTVVRIWQLDHKRLLPKQAVATPRYTNAKVILVGDTGVGKSGLSLVLTDQPFRATDSTHGRHVYRFKEEKITLDNGTTEIREILLWDLAGQPDYRIIHQLQLYEVTVALLIFDSRSNADIFSSVRYWNKALMQAQKAQGDSALPVRKLLVAARVDVGSVGLSQERIEALIEKLDLSGYYETSAKAGWGIDELREAIYQSIAWDVLPRVSSTELFEKIKDFLLSEKEKGRLLSTVDDLYENFRYTNPDDTRSEFETVIGLIEARGMIRRLNFGNLVLLQPEKLDSYASSIILAAREDKDGLGSIAEENILAGNFRMPDGERIPDRETERLLLIATVEDMLRYEIALRDSGELIFPSQFTRDYEDNTIPDDQTVHFKFEGAVTSIYTRLVVRLSRSGLFKLEGLYRDAAVYGTLVGRCGFMVEELDNGEGKLTVFYEGNVSYETRYHFEQYIESMLQRLAVANSLQTERIFKCGNCQEVMNPKHVQRRREMGHSTMQCPVCETQIVLVQSEERVAPAIKSKVFEIDRAADDARERATAVSRIQGKQATNDFDVFLSHNGKDKAEVIQIAEALRDLGLLPWLDVWQLPPGQQWRPQLEDSITSCRVLAFCIGAHGVGRWQDHELTAFMNLDRPIIPIILPNAPEGVENTIPTFLKSMTWVDFRTQQPDPIAQLVWGITGEKALVSINR